MNQSTGSYPEDEGTRGLKYKAFIPEALGKPIMVLDDGGPEALVDLRSICTALGTSWQRWQMLTRHRRKAWGAESCIDYLGRETYLIKASTVLRWMAEVHPLFAAHSRVSAARAITLRAVWRAEFEEALQADFPRLHAVKKSPTASSGRKINAATVYALYRARASGATFHAAAREAGVGVSTAKQIASDRYPAMPDDARQAWEKTFGADQPAPAPVIPANRRAGMGP